MHWNFTEPNPDPCTEGWQGIVCHGETIVILSLNSMNLVGNLSEDIGNLAGLVNLSIAGNGGLLGSPFPATVTKLTNLMTLTLSNDGLTGHLPEDFDKLSGLKHLDLSSNMLSGTLPAALGKLIYLSYLSLKYNRFTGPVDPFTELVSLIIADLSINAFNGTIPASIGQLTNLAQFSINGNALTGRLPKEIGDMRSMEQMIIGSNFLTGPIPDEIGQLQAIQGLSFRFNHLNGSIPASIGHLPRLFGLDLSINFFQGSLPDLGRLTKLNILDVSINELTGSIPAFLNSMTSLQSLDLSQNRFSKPIPESFCEIAWLKVVLLDQNHLSGPIPSNFGNMKHLYKFTASHNFFTGTLPSSIGTLATLSDIDFRYNKLHGTIPSSIADMDLDRFQVNDNFLTGTFPSTISEMPYMSLFEVGGNFLSGNVGELIGPVQEDDGSLQVFNISMNCFTGTLDRISDITTLYTIDLSSNFFSGTIPSIKKIVSVNLFFVQNNLLTGTIGNVYDAVSNKYFQSIDYSNNFLTGSLPEDAAQYKTLHAFFAMQNCFTGTIPEIICAARFMASLALDGLSTAKPCRQRTLPLPGLVDTYTLKPNAVHGTIPACFFHLEIIYTLHLSGNSLHGTIPELGNISSTLTDLSLSHNQLTGTIPKVLQGGKQWINLDLSFNKFKGRLESEVEGYLSDTPVALNINRLSGTIPSVYFDLSSVSILRGNMFSCGNNGMRNDLPRHDPSESQYACGSDTLNIVFICWAVIVAAIVLALSCLYLRIRNKTPTPYWVSYGNDLLKRLAAWQALYTAGRSMLYDHKSNAIEVLQNSIHCTVRLFQEMRNLGLVVAVFLAAIAIPVYVLLSVNFGSYEDQYAWTGSAAYLSGQPAALSLLFLFSALLLVVYLMRNSLVMKLSALFPDPDAAGVDATEGYLEKWSTSKWARRALALAAINVIVVMSVNIFFVYINSKLELAANLTLSLGMGMFKLWWSGIIASSVVSYLQPKSEPLHAVVHADNVLYLSSIVLFNTIVAPCFAALVASSDCFYYVITTPPSVNADVVYYSTETGTDLERKVVFQPPFSYSYQCSSALLVDYGFVFAYKNIIIGVLYPLFVCSVACYLDYELKTRQRDGVTKPLSKFSKWLGMQIPPVWRPNYPAVDQAHEHDEKPIATAPAGPVFSAADCIVRLSTMLATLFTFGVVLPYLAVIICFSLFTNTYLVQFGLAKFLEECRSDEARSAVVAQVSGQCRRLLRTAKLALRPVPLLAVLFFCFFLVDTEGDQRGPWRALFAALALLIILGVCWMVKKITDKASERKYQGIVQQDSESGNPLLHSM